MGFMNWRVKSADVLQQGGVIAPDERLPWPQTAVMGVQHVIAMFGATVLAPILMGFAREVAHTVAFMDQGELLETRPAAEFFGSPGHERSRAFLNHML